jgi:hypothetical protein
MEFCSKTSFATQKYAQEHLLRIFFEKSRGGRCPNQEYLCPHCNTWHLTSKGNRAHVYKLKINELQDKIQELSSKKKSPTQANETEVEVLIAKNLKLSRRIENELITISKRDKTIEDLQEKTRTYKNIMQNLRDKQTIIDNFFALLSAEKDIEVLSGISKFAEQKIKALKNG